MFWELIAAVFAGLAGAGIALSLRLVIKRLPKWIVPACAGLAMLGFVVYSEYSWYDHTVARLPSGVVVVATVPHTAFYKPWSYVRPQILQFVALDTASVTSHSDNTKRATLYFIERRMPTRPLAITVDCANPKLGFSDEMNANILQICH